MRALFLAMAACLLSHPGQAACTGDLPGKGIMNVYTDATSDNVIGGIGPDQCGLEVTDFCENGRCLAFFDGLSGYINVTGLRSGTLTPPPEVFTYRVSTVAGGLNAPGAETFDLSEDASIQVTPAADHVVLDLPDPLPKGIRLTSTGSSGWEGVLPDWLGVPVSVVVYLDRLGAEKATLELFTDSPLLTMDMRLALTRLKGTPQSESPAAPLRATPCDSLVAELRPILRGDDSPQKRTVLATMVALGITSFDPGNPKHCSEVEAALGKDE